MHDASNIYGNHHDDACQFSSAAISGTGHESTVRGHEPSEQVKTMAVENRVETGPKQMQRSWSSLFTDGKTSKSKSPVTLKKGRGGKERD